MQQRSRKYIKTAAVLILSAVAVWLFFAFALKWFLPFIIAFVIAGLIDPAVNYISAHLHVKRAFASAVCTLAVLGIVGAVITIVIWRAVYEVAELIHSMPEIIKTLSNFALELKDRIFSVFSKAPEALKQFVSVQIGDASEKMSSWAIQLTGKMISALSSMASFVPECVVCVVTTIISIFFFSSRYGEIKRFIKRQLPEKHHKTVSEIKDTAFLTLGKWLKSQLILSGITFAELAIAFCILKVRYAVLLALLVAVIDALPVLGTGIVLVPWACVSMLAGNFGMALGLLITYAVVVVVHNCTEPKLVSTQLGTNPIVTLIAMYVGFKTVGVLGMILFPIIFMILKQLNDSGYVRLWK